MKVFYLGVDVSKKKLDLCLRSNGKDILYDVIPNDLSSIKSWLTRTFEKFFLSEDSLVVCAEHTGQYTYPLVCATKSIGVYLCLEDAAKIIKHTKHDNRTVLIRAFKFTTNEDGNYHTQYP